MDLTGNFLKPPPPPKTRYLAGVLTFVTFVNTGPPQVDSISPWTDRTQYRASLPSFSEASSSKNHHHSVISGNTLHEQAKSSVRWLGCGVLVWKEYHNFCSSKTSLLTWRGGGGGRLHCCLACPNNHEQFFFLLFLVKETSGILFFDPFCVPVRSVSLQTIQMSS